jgi:hypothetical protein
LQFISCTGAVTQDVINNQVTAMAPGLGWETYGIGMVALSILGNDILFSKILVSCIGGIPFSGDCDEWIKKSRDKLYSTELWGRYELLLDAIIARTVWGGNKAAPVVYQTSYPAFFDSETDQCDKAVFNPIRVATKPLIKKSLRRKINLLTAEVNGKLKESELSVSDIVSFLLSFMRKNSKTP